MWCLGRLNFSGAKCRRLIGSQLIYIAELDIFPFYFWSNGALSPGPYPLPCAIGIESRQGQYRKPGYLEIDKRDIAADTISMPILFHPSLTLPRYHDVLLLFFVLLALFLPLIV